MDGLWHGVAYLGEHRGKQLISLHCGWMEVDVTVDSGACDTVMLTACAEHVRVHSHSQGNQGYEAANGSTIHNVGERRCWVTHGGGAYDTLTQLQVADIIHT